MQHARAYAPLVLRSQLVPLVNFASSMATWVIIAGLAILASTQNETVCWIGIGLIAMSALFALVTLPVEFNASRRAMQAIEQGNILSEEEQRGARKTLKAAAMTYVAATAVALAQLLRLIILFGGRRRRD